ncbi:hypothetical protein [Metabacillus endolithicus]|uniref:Uncharacterized protein n=1 Tax=Metabacillus endolithicus TaxID=1535204 RepID=A0ABW5BZD5_9BACI|nr:hypothetical protein [Metabacillus endolithicus]UPG65506.1 hypothetical protein MVE64_11345 [Metabacillus endolithicus]
MKLNPAILSIVVIAAVIVGLQLNGTSIVSLEETTNIEENKSTNTNSAETKTSNNTTENPTSSGLTPEFFEKFYSQNNFDILPVYSGTSSDIYPAQIIHDDIEVHFDAYHNRKTDEILLIEVNIDGSYYYNHTNQQEVEDYITNLAETYFVGMAAIPYRTSTPDEAKEWVRSHIKDSYAVEPKEKTSKKFGNATINVYGSPLFRTLEIDFGYAEKNI